MPGLSDRIALLGRAIRMNGVEIALAEVIDATRAAGAIGLDSRQVLKTALRSTMVKSPQHFAVFDAAFDRYFPVRPPGPSERADDDTDPAARLAGGDDLMDLAAQLVDAHGGFDGELRGERHHIQRVYRGADLARLMSEARQADPELSGDELRRQTDELKQLIATDVRGQLADRTQESIAAGYEDVEFLQASRAELDQIRAAIRPLARKMASRMARRRNTHNRGRMNFRRTAQKSIATGGVPFDLISDKPRPNKPQLFVLCDISGSVADVSVFTLTLMSALAVELAKTRSFVFVDAIDEVTDLLSTTDHGIEPWQLMRNTNVIGEDGHSDYGAVFTRFWEEVGSADLGPTATVLITGDGRTNYKAPQADVLERIARQCRHVYWFNPEPLALWETDDSEMAAYQRHCTQAFEVRTLHQLISSVQQIL